MRIIYECEMLAVLEDDDKYIVHILDNYRMVKELVVDRDNLISTLKKEINEPKNIIKGSLFGSRKKFFINGVIDIEKLLSSI